MIPTTKWMEKFLQDQRFSQVKPYLIGDVLDFGGNQGELKQYVKGQYTVVNYDHSPMDNIKADTIVSLATIEHLETTDIYKLFIKFNKMLNPGGVIFITTPTPASKGLLETMATIGLTDKANIAEHKHYWTKTELDNLGKSINFDMPTYKQFQFGLNQLAIFRRKEVI